MEMREWLSFIVIVMLVLILLDGFRRRWIDRKDRVLIKINKPNATGSNNQDYNTTSEPPTEVRTMVREEVTNTENSEVNENNSFAFMDEQPSLTNDASYVSGPYRTEPSFTEADNLEELLDDEPETGHLSTPFAQSNASKEGQTSNNKSEVIVINVMAQSGELISGRSLLPLLQRLGMRLGEMSIFHRHADSSGEGPVMFSMANMVEPGTFDIESMDSFKTPGISFFLQLPNSLGNMTCFEKMLEATTTIKDNLHADLRDENRSFITRQTIEHCRQRILDFELNQKLHQADQ